MKLPYILLAAFLACAAASAGTFFATKTFYKTHYENIILKANKAAEEKYTKLVEDKGKLETKLQETRNDIDQEYQTRLSDLNSTVARLRADVKLRDPGNKAGNAVCPNNSGSAAGTPEDAPETGVLSDEATDFLFSFAADADDTLEQLRACRAWVDETKSVIDTWNRDYISR